MISEYIRKTLDRLGYDMMSDGSMAKEIWSETGDHRLITISHTMSGFYCISLEPDEIACSETSLRDALEKEIFMIDEYIYSYECTSLQEFNDLLDVTWELYDIVKAI